MSTRYHTTNTKTRQSDNDSFTHQTAEVNISPRTFPRTAPTTLFVHVRRPYKDAA